ncbi:uncharacterized protein mIF3 [Palaemon carinicauda]|uniref:uncharacterized protein mIF3 n=1 Tax=Palaemon carinicauda TaxID=392227 RepID=UPI0035B5CA1C
MLINRGLVSITRYLRKGISVQVIAKGSNIIGGQPISEKSIPGIGVCVDLNLKYFHGVPTQVALFKSCISKYGIGVHGLSMDSSNIYPREFHTSSVPLKTFSDAVKSGNQENERKMGKKRLDDGSPLILLIENAESSNMLSVTLKQAERIAKRRDLKLVLVEDPSLKGKPSRSIYKLITGREYYEISRAKKEEKSTSGIKGEKTLTLNGNIAANDLKSKLQNIKKWLTKGYQVRVTISAKGGSAENVEGVFNEIKNEVENIEGRILQRREKNGDTKFYVAPPKEKKVKMQPGGESDSPKHEDAEQS